MGSAAIIGRRPAPAWFYAVGFAGMLWMLIGLWTYLIHVGLLTGPPQTDAERDLVASMPVWVTTAYAVAVFTGLAGTLAWLLSRKLARPLLLLSLAALIVQDSWVLIVSDAKQVHGASAVLMPLVVVAVAIALLIGANTGVKRGWLR